MNSEKFGGSYNGYGFNADGTERDRNDLGSEDFGRNDNPDYSTLDSYRKEEIKEEVEEMGYEETVREDLDRLYAELDKQPRDDRILGYIALNKSILERLEKEVKAEAAGNINKIGSKVNAVKVAEPENLNKLGDTAAADVSYVNKDGLVWTSRENAIQNDDDKYNR